MTLVERRSSEGWGMPRERLLVERFEASGDGRRAAGRAEEAMVIDRARITIHFEGKTHKVPYARD
jgi:hypothetical protein